MPKHKITFAAALSALLLASCGSQGPTTAENGAGDAKENARGNASPYDPGRPGTSVNGVGEPVPPPDAVSHPDGYLPNASDIPLPAEGGPATANPPGSDTSPPATEDEYIRNKQVGR